MSDQHVDEYWAIERDENGKPARLIPMDDRCIAMSCTGYIINHIEGCHCEHRPE